MGVLVGNTIGKRAIVDSAGFHATAYEDPETGEWKEGPADYDPEADKKDYEDFINWWPGAFHQMLDLLGNIPVFGAFFDGVNAFFYAIEGNLEGALDSLGSAVMDLIPGPGEAGHFSKYIGRGVDELEGIAKKIGGKLIKVKYKKGDKGPVKSVISKNSEKEPGKDGGKVKNKNNKKECKKNVGVGHPVNPMLGVKFLAGEEDVDFDLPAILSFPWQRSYYSDQLGNGWLGQGWSTPLSMSLLRESDRLVLINTQGSEISLPVHGRREYIRHAQFYLCCEANGRYRISLLGGNIHYLFAPLALNEHDPKGQCAHRFQLVGIENRNGNHIRIIYGEDGLPVYIHDSANRILKLYFQALPLSVGGSVQRLYRIAKLHGEILYYSQGGEQPADTLVSYDYSPEGDLVCVSNADGLSVREYHYKNHILVEHGQPGALVASYEYDQYKRTGKVISHSTNLGQNWKFRYLSGRTEVTDSLGDVSCYLFNENNFLTGFIDAAGNEIFSEVDAWGNPIAFTDPDGRTTRYTYNAWGNRSSIMDAMGRRIEIQYDTEFQQPLLVTNAEGDSKHFEYDSVGNLVRLTNELGHIVEYTYNDAGLVAQIINAKGGKVSLEYDERGRLVCRTDCSQLSTRYTYDAHGYLNSATDATGAARRYWYDPKGRLLAIQRADGTKEEFTYDTHGRLIHYVNALGGQTRWELAADGLPTAICDSLGYVLHYEYDAARRLVRIINEGGDEYHFSYDIANNLVEEKGFDGKRTCYRNTPAGMLLEKIEFGVIKDSSAEDAGEANLSQVLRTFYEYDKLGRLVSKMAGRACDKRLDRTRYEYDSLDRLVLARNASGRIERVYDALGQLISEASCVLGKNYTVRYRYDEVGNRLQTTLPNSRNINYLYYGVGHQHQINLDGELISDIGRDALHREVSRTQGRLTSFYQYNSIGKRIAQYAIDEILPSHQQVPAIQRSYQYDSIGNVLRVTGLHSNVHDYQYDQLGRLLVSGGERFSFDPAHNLLDSSAAQSGDVVHKNLLLKYEDKNYAYDTHGNLIEKKIGMHTRMLFEYNTEHQVEFVHVFRGGTEQKIHYGYDAFGRRVFKKDLLGVDIFTWEGDRILSEARDGLTLAYIYESNGFVPLAQIVMHDGSEPSARIGSMGFRYFHTDQIGMPHELSDSEGRVLWRASYKAWGGVKTLESTSLEQAQGAARRDENYQPLRFQGQYFDSETGLHYNRYRYYDPDIGRFITQDPIGLRGGVNFYRYAPNPGGWTDPLGLAPPCKPLNLFQPGTSQYAGCNNLNPMDLAADTGLPIKKKDYIIGGHGNSSLIGGPDGSCLTAEQLADKMKQSGYKKNQKTVLVACSTGKGDNPFAQSLANETGNSVYAPSSNLDMTGSGYVNCPGGNWNEFKPDKKDGCVCM